MDMANALSGIGTAFDDGIKMAQPIFFGLGAIYGGTADQSYSGPFTEQLEKRINDFSQRAIGWNPNLGGYGSSLSQKFNLTGFLNKGLLGAAVVSIYKWANLPYAKEIYGIVFPLSIGFSVGGLVDDPVGRSQSYPSQSQSYQTPISYAQTPSGGGLLTPLQINGGVH